MDNLPAPPTRPGGRDYSAKGKAQAVCPTDADRMEIEHGLRHRQCIKKIAAKIGQRHSTLEREIRARSVPSDKGALDAYSPQ